MTSPDTEHTMFEQLFPVPSSSPSAIGPVALPGISVESTWVLQALLKEDYQQHHVFFNDKHFHNHTIHHLLAIYSLGASGAILQAAYAVDRSTQRPVVPSPSPITVENFSDHLGDENYYAGYLRFFSTLVLSKGISATVEEWIFSSKANFTSKQEEEGGAQPEMLNRFLAGLLHPLIHTGHGLEFGLPGVVAEGLAQAAVHNVTSSVLIPSSSFDFDLVASVDSAFVRVTSLFPKMVLNTLNQHAPPTSGTHAFSIMSRILRDPRFKPDKEISFEKLLRQHGEAIRIYASEWTVEGADPKDVAEKIQQIAFMNVLIYGVGGWEASNGFVSADFFYMHLVTSSLFLPSIVAHLTASSTSLLLRTYFTHSLAHWISEGRANLDISGYFTAPFTPHVFPGPQPTPSEGALSEGASTLTPNPWLPILQTALVHPDDHLPKVQRALNHYARLYGMREAGKADFRDTELEGAELIDGSLFLRAASMTAQKLGRVREGEDAGDWGRN